MPRSPRLTVTDLEPRWTPATLKVDDDLAQFPNAAFQTIAAAVAAAGPNDTVLVAPGTYREQVSVPAGKNGLTLKSSTPLAAKIAPPAALTSTGALVRVTGSRGVTLRDFVVTGPDAGGAAGLQWGIQVDGGGSALITGNAVTRIRRDPADGVQTGVAILVGGTTAGGSTAGTATITDNLIGEYQKGGVVVANVGSSATITGNRVLGRGAAATVAQNGIQVSGGAAAAVVDNVVALNGDPTPGKQGIGIFFDGAKAGAVVRGNAVQLNQTGIVIQDTPHATVADNAVNGSYVDGIALVNAGHAAVTGNAVWFSGRDGIQLDDTDAATVAGNGVLFSGRRGVALTGGSAGNHVTGNVVALSGGSDLFDDTTGTGTGGTANAWAGNLFLTRNRAGLR